MFRNRVAVLRHSSLVVALAGVLLVGCGSEASKGSASASAEAKSSAKPAASGSAAAGAGSAAAGAGSAKPKDAPKDDGSVTITKHFPVVGDKSTASKSQKMNMKIAMTSPKGDFSSDGVEEELEEKTEECLAVEAKKCSKLKVTYTKAEKRNALDGKPADTKTAPFHGKTYVIELKDGTVTVAHEDGSAPPAEELEAVKKNYRHFAQENELLEALPASVKVGDSLDGVAKALGSRIMDDGDGTLSKRDVKVTVASIKEENGKKVLVLDLSVALEGKDPNGGVIVSSVKGTVELRADAGVATKVEIKGPLEITYDGTGPDKVAGKGNGVMTSTTTTTHSF